MPLSPWPGGSLKAERGNKSVTLRMKHDGTVTSDLSGQTTPPPLRPKHCDGRETSGSAFWKRWWRPPGQAGGRALGQGQHDLGPSRNSDTRVTCLHPLVCGPPRATPRSWAAEESCNPLGPAIRAAGAAGPSGSQSLGCPWCGAAGQPRGASLIAGAWGQAPTRGRGFAVRLSSELGSWATQAGPMPSQGALEMEAGPSARPRSPWNGDGGCSPGPRAPGGLRPRLTSANGSPTVARVKASQDAVPRHLSCVFVQPVPALRGRASPTAMGLRAGAPRGEQGVGSPCENKHVSLEGQLPSKVNN